MSKISKYDKLYKYINKRIANSVECLEEKLKKVEKEETQYKGSTVVYYVEPSYESKKEELRQRNIYRKVV